MRTFISRIGSGPNRTALAAGIGAAVLIATGCGTNSWLDLLRQIQAPPDLKISFVLPLTTQNAAPGAPATIKWADVASQTGAFVTLKVQRVDPATRDVISEIQLVPFRDALSDGDSDKFDWDVSGVIVGSYNPVIRLESPDGRVVQKSATGDFNVTSGLPTPLLTFTNPATTDVTVASGNTVTLTWTDNGVANPDTKIDLALDPTPANHQSGDEIIIAQNIAASDNGANGTFDFNTRDINNTLVPEGTYTLFATLDDSVHDNLGKPLTVDAVGRIVITP